jgi:Putative auto-transporter adhesin, head GIN domain
MQKLYLYAGFATLVATASAMSDERRYSVGNISAVAVTGVNATISVGPRSGVVLTGSPRDIAQVKLVVENGELRLKPYNSDVFNWKTKLLESISIHITVHRLTEVSIAGAGNVTATGIKSKYFTVSVGGGGSFASPDADVGNIELSIGNGGTIAMGGTCNRADIGIGGSGKIEAAALKCLQTHINTTNGGEIEAYASQSATTVTAGGGAITIYGNPAKRSHTAARGGSVAYLAD